MIKGATEIEVTVIPTGKQYTAHVVGTDPTEDVAVLELDKASGLATIPLGDSSKVRVGDAVVALGNAGGKGGAPHVVTGSVEALYQEITASDQSGADAERLTGLLQVNAGILPGDSGGALANADGQVIGMNTAASSSNQFQSTSSQGFAIPIAHALSIAKEITAGHASATIHIGLPALLGVQVSPSGSLGGNSQGGYGGNTGGTTSNGADVAGVASGSPADKLGIVAGDTVTAIDGDAVTTPESLSTIIRTHQPGEKVTVTWTDQSGTRHSGSATLITGPAD